MQLSSMGVFVAVSVVLQNRFVPHVYIEGKPAALRPSGVANEEDDLTLGMGISVTAYTVCLLYTSPSPRDSA